MCHEWGHNFLQGSDLYGGGGGKIGYWDLLGDNSPAGQMSDTSSFYKVRLDWMRYNAVLNGPVLPAAEYRLGPFATTGDAYKVVPDPQLNPGEYFILEYRAATGGDPAWTPDQGLGAGGLLITHVNERLGDGAPAVVSASPFMDVEEADRNDGKCWDDRGLCDLPWSDPPNTPAGPPGLSTYPPNNWPAYNRPAGILYPFGGKDRFTPDSDPSSDLYGGRPSGLSITNIRLEGDELVFTLEMTGLDQTRLRLRARTRYWLADFNGDGLDEVLTFDGDTLALCALRQNQLLVIWRARDRIGAWNLGTRDRLAIGDFNGDGRADVFIRSDRWAGLLLCDGTKLNLVWMTGDPEQGLDWIGGWHLGAEDRHYVGDFDGDGVDDIFIRSDRWAGLLLSTGNGFESVWMTGDPEQNLNWIGGWRLGAGDRHYVGDFDGDGRDDIFIRSARWAGLLLSTGNGFENVWMTGDPERNGNWIGGWRLGRRDRHYVGDFDGDGRADIFIRSARWAGLLLSNGRGFDNVWMTGDPAENLDWIGGWHLGRGDRHVVGDFNGDGIDDVFVRSEQWAAILLSDGRSLRMEWISGNPAEGANWIGPWPLQAGDRQRAGRLHFDPKADVFTYRPGATGTFITVFDGDASQFQPRCGWIGGNRLAPCPPGPGRDRFVLGNFAGDGRTDVVVFNGARLALYRNDAGTLKRIWRSGERIGGWALGPFDRLYVGDFDGDGRDDLFIRSPLWAGLLRSTGSGFENVWISGDPAENRNWIGGWRLGPKDQHVAGNFTSDNRADIFIRSAHWAALLRATGSGFENVWMTGDPAENLDWIGGWHLGPQDRHTVGRFTGSGRHDIFIRSPLWAGLLRSTGSGFESVWISGDPAENRNWIGGWRLGPRDRHFAGNFTGGLRDDIFIRSPRWAALLRATGSGFENVWMTGDPAENLDWIGGWHLSPGDRHVVGDFNGDGRADIYIRSDEWAGLLVADGAGLASALVQEERVGAWQLNRYDAAEAGRFTTRSRDEIFTYHPLGWTGVLAPAGTGNALSLSLVMPGFRTPTAG
jgi:ribosome modulation factor